MSTDGERGAPVPSLLVTLTFLVQKDYFHNLEVAGGHTERLLPRAQGDMLKTCPVCHHQVRAGCPSPPGCRCGSLDRSDSFIGGMQPATSCPLGATGALPAPPHLPAHRLHGQIKCIFLSLSPTCCATQGGKEMGLWAPLQLCLALLLSPFKCLHTLVCKCSQLCLTPVSVLHLLTPYMPLAGIIQFIVVEIPACAPCSRSVFFWQRPSVAAPGRDSSCVNFLSLSSLI